uniref:Thioredoxin domain-containing protein n=1 Tax=Alexandrium andersonii TaxID=327968 RepID=A0A7S2FVC8_9DINO|mmetsp:Transcript_33077/g.75298  ORF Transcript_33077/g.75298 Transcript_33077/m.75298 type:complete len:168 (+) Transcript_33077:133-636(+)
MKPAWDKLMRKYKNSTTLLVADVDCTSDGKALCQDVGVKGYPTIKYGDPADLQDYKGGRAFEELQSFAESLEKTCSAARAEHCSAEDQGRIREYTGMSTEARQALIEEQEAEITQLEKEFQEKVDSINKRYKEEGDRKEAAVKAVKDSGLGILKAFRAVEKKGVRVS